MNSLCPRNQFCRPWWYRHLRQRKARSSAAYSYRWPYIRGPWKIIMKHCYRWLQNSRFRFGLREYFPVGWSHAVLYQLCIRSNTGSCRWEWTNGASSFCSARPASIASPPCRDWRTYASSRYHHLEVSWMVQFESTRIATPAARAVNRRHCWFRDSSRWTALRWAYPWRMDCAATCSA